MAASNESRFLSLSLEDERRFFVAHMNEGRMGDTAFFSKLHKELENGGYEAMLWELLERDVEGWRPRNNIPTTSAAVEQKVRGLGPLAQFCFNLFHEGHLPFMHEGDWLDEPVRGLKDDFKYYFEIWCRDNEIRPGASGRSNFRLFNEELLELFGEGFRHDVKMKIPEDRVLSSIPLHVHNDGRAWAYQIPPLPDCRKHMEKRLGGQIDWPV